MTKKQFGIIFTLMALIVCVGVISAKLNSDGQGNFKATGVIDPSDLSQVLAKDDDESKTDVKPTVAEKETLGSQDYFYSQRSVKDQLNATTTQQLKAITEDVNTSQEKKDLATTELQDRIMIKDKEGRIETNVMSKGFEDVLCYIEGNKVRVVLKVQDPLTESQTSAIQEIVEDVSSISDVIIEPKK
ncbi:MAG: SpoIIIAH-like family protein [Clostridium sp.]